MKKKPHPWRQGIPTNRRPKKKQPQAFDPLKVERKRV